MSVKIAQLTTAVLTETVRLYTHSILSTSSASQTYLGAHWLARTLQQRRPRSLQLGTPLVAMSMYFRTQSRPGGTYPPIPCYNTELSTPLGQWPGRTVQFLASIMLVFNKFR